MDAALEHAMHDVVTKLAAASVERPA